MIKRLARFFLFVFAAGILFIGCPIEYVPSVQPPPPLPADAWQRTVRLPEGFSGVLEGTEVGWLWWAASPAIRPSLQDRVVTVKFTFDNGRMTNLYVCYQHESDYAFVRNAVATWRNRVLQMGGILAIPPYLYRDTTVATNVTTNRYHYRWSRWDLNAFSGATITVNALSLAARDAFEDFIESANGNGCGILGCDCQNCTGTGCDCGSSLPPITRTGRSPGFFFYAADVSADIAFVEVTFFFSSEDGRFLNVVTYTPEETDHYVARQVTNWEERIRTLGLQGIPSVIFPQNDDDPFVPAPHLRDLWPSQEYVDAFAGATFTINALTRAAHIALED